jgi:hypothetical protein
MQVFHAGFLAKHHSAKALVFRILIMIINKKTCPRMPKQGGYSPKIIFSLPM